LLATRESARGAFSSLDEKQGRESGLFAQLAVSDARSASLTSDYLSLEIKHFLQGLRFIDYMMKVAKRLSRFTISSRIQITAGIQPAPLCRGLCQLNAFNWHNCMI
jgi:hypothetical protein